MPAEMLEMMKSLKKKNEDILLKLSKLDKNKSVNYAGDEKNAGGNI